MAAILALLVLDGPARAQDSTASAAGEVQLEEVNVVASPIIQGNKVDRYGATTTVVGQDQIEDLGALDISSALRRTPGVTITRYNQVGAFGGGEGGAVFIRGMGSSRPGAEIKTYIDGVPVYMGLWNHPLIDLLPVDPAESIEVIKGPQPNRFGDALSAINITPKRMRGDDSTTIFNIAGGSYATVSQSLEHGGMLDAFDYYLGEGFRYSQGHRTNADGRQASGFANLGYELNDYWDARLFALGTDNTADDPGPDDDSAESDGTYKTRLRMATLTLANDFGMADGEIKFFVSGGEGYWYDQPGNDDECLNDFWFWGLKLRERVEITDRLEVTGGLDQQWWDGKIHYSYDDGSTNSVQVPRFSLSMPYGAVSYLFGDEDGWHLIPSVGARLYEHSHFDSRTAPHYGLVAGYGPLEVHASASRGVSYPGHDVAVVFPTAAWEDLEPEVVDHREVGVSLSYEELVKLEVSYFNDDGENRYVFSTPPYPPTNWTNTEEYRIEGFEASLNVTPTPDLALFAGLTRQNTRPADMPYAPETTVSAGFNWQFLKDFELSMDCEYVSDMYALKQTRKSGATNTEEVEEHFLVNARLGWTVLLETWDTEAEFYVSLQNITDESYEYKPEYPMPGINGMIGMKLTF
ncbi:TonB-dependent receptor [Desulfocurvus sp. DL9XJH121]